MARYGWIIGAVALATAASAAVFVSVGDPRISEQDGGRRTAQSVTLANEVCLYTLCYDIIRHPEQPDTITSHWWAWTTGMTTLGMTEPSNANWYFQSFLNWRFDDESLHVRPAVMRVIRDGGADGMVEYTWDTPKVTASLRFALTSGSDKLLMFGHWEPKVPVQNSTLVLSCYPTGFAEPRNRAVTTAERTARPGETVVLDLARERWVLYEDTTPGRPGDGPAGLLIGTPESFREVRIPVGGYGIVTELPLRPEARSFALALYDFPALPEVEENRAYFRESGTREAEWLGRVAARLEEPLPPLPIAESRRQALGDQSRRRFERPAERWAPDPTPLEFPWAAKLAREPLRTVVFCPRWSAYEVMELARRAPLQVRHLYFDGRNALSEPDAWPYRHQTGIGTLGFGVLMTRAAELASAEDVDLYLCAGVSGAAVPTVARNAILERVAAGRGLFLAGRAGEVDAWGPEVFAEPDAELAEAVLAAFPLDRIPGHIPGSRGRPAADPPVRAYRYGQGRIVALRAGLGTYSSLVPLNDETEGLEAATDRCLALAARAALVAAGWRPETRIVIGDVSADRQWLPFAAEPAPREAVTVRARVQDDLGRTLSGSDEAQPPRAGAIALPAAAAARPCFVDLALVDADGRCLDFASTYLPAAPRATIGAIALEPSRRLEPPAPPIVDLPDGGRLRCTVEIGLPAGVEAVVELAARDAFGRLVGRAETPAGRGGQVTAELTLTPPVTVCHELDVRVRSGDVELAFERRRFTMPVAYPYDDFTALMWTYAGGEPVLQRTTRLCYENGAEMQDLCHMRGYTDAGAAREYAVAARSGLRLVPYVTRIAGSADPQGVREPCLHDPDWVRRENASITVCSRQAAPYFPAAFTLGDENYLLDGANEGCQSPATMAAFQDWLRAKYGAVDRLNAVWGTAYNDFADITTMMRLAEAAEQTTSFAAFLDHKRFMDTAFARAHETFADTIRAEVPGAKVGWDGFLGYHWRAGYDFEQLTANLELNQTYRISWLQNELVRSFRRPDALTGTWGNAVADRRETFQAAPWDGLLSGDNSIWWWTSWGCDYIPFNPDLSLSAFGEGWFEGVRETGSGPGKLLLHATRRTNGIAVLYSQVDLFAATVFDAMGVKAPFAASFLNQQELLLATLADLGLPYHHISLDQLAAGRLSPDRDPVLLLCLPSCLSDEHVAAIRAFVEAGGTLVVDGRAGLLTADGAIRPTRPLDELFGVRSPAGLEAIRALPAAADTLPAPALEPGVRLTTGAAQAMAGETPVVVRNRVGRGQAVLLNLDLSGLAEERLKPGPLAELLAGLAAEAGVRPACTVTGPDGARLPVTRQALFVDGDLRYLGVMQDFLLRGLGERPGRIALPEPCYVYDVRAGRPVGDGPTRSWDVVVRREYPLLFALLPYRVAAVEPSAPAGATAGQVVELGVAVRADGGDPQFHVVRLDVFPPGATTAHRQYSQNVVCPGGRGAARIGLALNDPPGAWRLVWHDIASGVRAESSINVVGPR